MTKTKRKQYHQNDLKSAINDVKSNRLKMSQAAREYNVPRKTIFDHVKGKLASSTTITKPGIAPMLTADEENSLENYIMYMAKRGFPITRCMLKVYATAIAQASGRKTLFNVDKGPSNKWIRKFLLRHPTLCEKFPEAQEKSHSRMSNMTVMNQYFKLLDDTVTELGLGGKGAQIFNCDETGFSSKEKSRGKVLGLKRHHSYQQQVLTNTHITVHMCVAGDGRVLPSFLIFAGGLPHRSYKDGVPGDWLYGSSNTGYMDKELFDLWFKHVFLVHCGSRRPVLLVLDNHDTHISINVIKKAKENDVHILGLPPHTTHILQPLDVGVYGPLKEKVRSLAISLGQLSNSVTIGKAKFPVLLSTAIDQVCSPAKVKEAFKKSGLFPVDIKAVDHSQITPADFLSKSQLTDGPSNSFGNADNASVSTSIVLCHSCGTEIDIDQNQMSAPSKNPLVTSGLIPETLASVLVPPTTVVKTQKSKKIVTEARVITGDKMIEKLVSSANKEKEKAEEKERKKIERAIKKNEKEQKKIELEKKRVERQLKKKMQQNERKKCQRKKHSESEMEVNVSVHCIVCGELEPDGEGNIDWYQCEKCERWAHQACVESVFDENFVCTVCKEEE